MESDALLERYPRQPRLPTFLQNYRAFNTDAARSNHNHVRYLLALVEEEIIQREQNRRQRRIKAAKFPAMEVLQPRIRH